MVGKGPDPEKDWAYLAPAPRTSRTESGIRMPRGNEVIDAVVKVNCCWGREIRKLKARVRSNGVCAGFFAYMEAQYKNQSSGRLRVVVLPPAKTSKKDS